MARPTSEMFLPAVDLREMAKAALWNVDYHLGAVQHFNEQPGMTTNWQIDVALDATRKGQLQTDINRFHAHLRSFFWEMIAAFEAMKVWIIETRGRNSAHMKALEKSTTADWFVEVSNYRNFAHRSFLVSQSLFQESTQKMIHRSLLAARRGGGQPAIPESLVEYRNHMNNVFGTIQQVPVSEVSKAG
jgi:hypothetical protein